MTSTYVRYVAACWLTVLTLLSALAQASPSDALSRLEALIQQQDHQAAWQLASELLVEHEGTPRFDYLFALAARGVGQPHQAVYALERALAAWPQSSDIRLALAVSYFELGNLAAAERELQQLADTPLPERASRLVQSYLQRINKLRQPDLGYWQNWLQLGIGSDSNPNSGVDEEFFFVPLLGQIRLFEQSLQRDSNFYELQAQLNWILPQDQHSAFYLSAGLLQGDYTEQVVFSRTYASALAGYQTKWRDYRLSAELFYRPLQLDGHSYLHYQGVKTTLSLPLTDVFDVGLDLTYARQSYAELTALDKTQLQVDSWLSARFGSAEHKVQLRWGQEDSQQIRTGFNSRDYLGVGYRWQQMLDDHWMSSLALDYLGGEYDERHPLFVQVRDDSFYRAELELSYRFNPQWRVLTSLSYMRNDSNIAIYQYRRTRGWIGVRYAF